MRFVALDQRSHGESDQPDTGYDFRSVVDDLTAFIDGIGLTQPSVLVGHSWGASLVLHFAVTRQSELLVSHWSTAVRRHQASAGHGRNRNSVATA